MAVFFTSDTHFGDPRVLRIDKRPFKTIPEHDEALVARWNETVSPEDEVWHLGDFALHVRPERIDELLGLLNGRKHLIRGNNDPDEIAALSAWESVASYAEIERDGRALILCHYPFRSWNGQHRKAIDLHGHSHGRLKPLPRQFDVGVDARDFAPVTLAELLGDG